MKSSKRSSAAVPDGAGEKVHKVITINKPVDQVFAFWRNLDNLPQFLRHLESIRDLGGGRSHWVVKGPAGKLVEWDAEIIEEKENQMISWRSLEGANVDNSGSVWFEGTSDGSETDLKVSMKYSPPGGKAGVAVAKLFGRDADAELEEDLFILKALLETGRAPDEKEVKRASEVVRTVEG